MKRCYRKTLIFLVFFSFFGAYASFALANVTTVVLPNGGECLTVNQNYTIQFSYSGSDVEHIALYYKTDGVQPTHLDGTEIKHPINVPQQGTTYNWKPLASNISETGRIWIDGHGNGHNSLSTWDSSNANFAVRSSCAEVPTPTAAVGGRILPKVPPPPAGFQNQAKAFDVIPTSSSGRLRFESPWREGQYKVRLVEDRGGSLYNIDIKEVFVKPGDIVEFSELKLKPNTFYQNNRFIIAYDFESSTESVFSEVMRPFWTLPEKPKQPEVKEITSTNAVLTLFDEVPNLEQGLTGVLFEEVNSVDSSDWIKTTSWEITNLKPDTQYQYFAKLRSGSGDVVPHRALVTFRTKPLPVPTPSIEEIQSKQVKELEERVKKIAKVVAGYQELVAVREKEIREIEKGVEEVIGEPFLPEFPKTPKPEVQEKKAIDEEILPKVPPRSPQEFTVNFDGVEAFINSIAVKSFETVLMKTIQGLLINRGKEIDESINSYRDKEIEHIQIPSYEYGLISDGKGVRRYHQKIDPPITQPTESFVEFKKRVNSLPEEKRSNAIRWEKSDGEYVYYVHIESDEKMERQVKKGDLLGRVSDGGSGHFDKYGSHRHIFTSPNLPIEEISQLDGYFSPSAFGSLISLTDFLNSAVKFLVEFIEYR